MAKLTMEQVKKDLDEILEPAQGVNAKQPKVRVPPDLKMIMDKIKRGK